MDRQAPPADGRRRIARTDALLADPRLAEAAGRLGRGVVKAAVVAAQRRARAGRSRRTPSPTRRWRRCRRPRPGCVP